VRLSIIDLSNAGSQPMSDSTGRYVIAFNGEVYNFKELKLGLEKGFGPIAWRSQSDTEVVVEGFARWGASFLDRLNGIFALTIYDRVERTLHVLRDPLGIKPLFFTRQKGCVYFASELKALLAVPGLKRTLRQQSLAEQLAFMYVPEPHTMYDEFLKVAPGQLLTFRDGESQGSQKLFDWIDAPLDLPGDSDTIDLFADTFSRAVKRQLTSDVPVSLMLSGGIDSSAVGVEAVNAGASLKGAYTIAFDAKDMTHDRYSSDIRYAMVVAQRLNLKLEIIPARLDFISMIPSLSQFVEDGISDPAAINTYLICQAARENGIKVMLTGHGADEFLGGYRRYLAHELIKIMPSSLRAMVQKIGRFTPLHVPGRFNAVARRFRRIASLAGQTNDQRMLDLYTWAQADEIKPLFNSPGEITIGSHLLDMFKSSSHMEDVDAMMKVDRHYDLMSLNLTYTDRLSMAAGVEARVPYLDFELVRLMNSIPLSLKLKRSTSKYILKKAMEDKLPRDVVYRQKAGFGLPLRAWLREESELLRHYLDPSRIARQGIFNSTMLESMCRRHYAGTADFSNLLFSMLCIQAWLDTQLGETSWVPAQENYAVPEWLPATSH
jgi:asparagine synthase (glutamine-hydrolysing)